VHHGPESTLLYQLIEEYNPAFAAQMAASSTMKTCCRAPLWLIRPTRFCTR
jgi:hypothetical protein